MPEKELPLDERIEQLKKKHKVGAIEHIMFSDGRECFLKRPSRQVISLALARTATAGAAGQVDVILENCWLEGDESLKEDPGALVGFIQKLDDIVGVITAEVKNY